MASEGAAERLTRGNAGLGVVGAGRSYGSGRVWLVHAKAASDAAATSARRAAAIACLRQWQNAQPYKRGAGPVTYPTAAMLEGCGFTLAEATAIVKTPHIATANDPALSSFLEALPKVVTTVMAAAA